MLSKPSPGVKLTPESLSAWIGRYRRVQEIIDVFHCSRGDVIAAAAPLLARGTHVFDRHGAVIRKKPPELTTELLIEYVGPVSAVNLPFLAMGLMCSVEHAYKIGAVLEARGTHVISPIGDVRLADRFDGVVRGFKKHVCVGPISAYPFYNRKVRHWRGRMAVSKQYGRASYAVDELPRPVEEIKAILGEKYGFEFE